MGWMLILVNHCVGLLDRLPEKAAAQALPDLEALLLDPHAILAKRTLTVGPARRYASALCLGLLLAAGGTLLLFLGFEVLIRPHLVRPGPALRDGFLFLAVFTILLVGATALMLRRLRGGDLVLTRRGVELRYRDTVVCCPWALFYTHGQPFCPGHGWLVVPVVAAAASGVEVWQQEQRLAAGMGLWTRQFQFRSPHEAQLRAFYEVNALELGKILLHLGRILGADSKDAGAAEAEEPAPASANGWLPVRLTRLAFPPVCCACGAATPGRQKFSARESLLGLGRLLHPTHREAVHLWIPVCYACQTESHRQFWQAIVAGVVAGVLAILVAAAGVWLWPGNLLLVLVFLGAVLFAPFLGCMIGYQVGKKRSVPVELRRYVPRHGTLALRFRRAEYAEQLREAMRAGAR